MKKFEMVKYGRWEYPTDVPIRISEIAGHFDKSDIYPKQEYSLHTEYSFGSREFNSCCLNGLDVIRSSNLYGIPQLWKNREWAQEFAQFITAICAGHSAPEVIEVHPPFIDYTGNMHNFIEVYKEFEYSILEKYPNVKICIENRCGSRYKTSPFLFSKYTSFFELCEEIQREHTSAFHRRGNKRRTGEQNVQLPSRDENDTRVFWQCSSVGQRLIQRQKQCSSSRQLRYLVL